MGSNDFAAAARRLHKAGERLARIDRDKMTRVATLTRNDMRGPIQAATGGDFRLSHVGKAGARANVRYDLGPNAYVPLNGFVMEGTGALKLLEVGAKPHLIRAKAKRRRANPRASVFGAGYDNPIRQVRHPGTRPARTWSKAAAAVVPKIPRYYQRAIAETMADIYRKA